MNWTRRLIFTTKNWHKTACPPHQLLKADEDRDYAIRNQITHSLLFRLSVWCLKRMLQSTQNNFWIVWHGSFISRQAQDVQTAMIGYLLKELARDKEQYISTLNLTSGVGSRHKQSDFEGNKWPAENGGKVCNKVWWKMQEQNFRNRCGLPL